MDVIFEFTAPWKEGNYMCTQHQYAYLNKTKIRVEGVPSWGDLIITVPTDRHMPDQEVAIDLHYCKMEIFPEDEGGCRSFAVLKVKPMALKLR